MTPGVPFSKLCRSCNLGKKSHVAVFCGIGVIYRVNSMFQKLLAMKVAERVKGLPLIDPFGISFRTGTMFWVLLFSRIYKPVLSWLVLGALLVSGFASGPPDAAFAGEEVGIQVPEGFEVTLFADDDLAHDVHAMTVDSLGRIVVSGLGYVRILVDDDGDGRADRFIPFADEPKTGAQGMHFHGRDLLCTGDGGLLRYRDRDGDDKADGPPEVFLKCKTGAEHHAHAIEKGPDGWWYVIAGNFAGITGAYATLETSPIKKPYGGTLIRLAPDLSAGEIVADGFRNAYDFSFNSHGDTFTFDSDGERDVSLPWYRPTRVFHVLPGSNAGWVDGSWKRPGCFPDMPPVVASLGRGSPTGVVTYRHHRFPPKYRDAVFALDWTFGRVFALPLQKQGTSWRSEVIRFMTAVGQFGFAPTDAVVGPDGALYVCVGGRGTRGGVFRVSYTKAEHTPDPTVPTTPEDKLTACLEAPQPLCSWSRARWVPVARALGAEPFREAALDEGRTPRSRMRAIEILTELFGGLNHETSVSLAHSPVVEVRARAVWSIGRTRPADPDTDTLAGALNDTDPMVERAALESLLGADADTEFAKLIPGLLRQLNHSDRFNRQCAARIVPKLDSESFRSLSMGAAQSGWQATLTTAFGFVARQPGLNKHALEVGLRVLEGSHPEPMKREAVRLLQLGLGDVGGKGKLPPVLTSYVSRLDLSQHERQLDAVRVRLAGVFPSGISAVDFELARLLAMLAPYNGELLDAVLGKITEDSQPVDDIHYLTVSARIPATRTKRQRDVTAKALVDLEMKVQSRQLTQDTNWDDRVGEMYGELVKLDALLPAAIVERPNFGWSGHVMFLSQLPADRWQRAIEAFVAVIDKEQDDFHWNNDVIFLLGESSKPEHLTLIREQFENFAVRSSVLLVLSKQPEDCDRLHFVEGLESPVLEVIGACVDALAKLPAGREPDEQIALLRAMRRLGSHEREFPIRDRIVSLLRRNTGQQFGYESGPDGHRAQSDVVGKWTEWLSETYPEEASQLSGSQADMAKLKELLAKVQDWQKGDAAQGKKLHTLRACAQCHGERGAMGPDLAGVAGRFSREDLFIAIALPNRDVSPLYQTTLIETVDGKVYIGLVVYDSVDGLTLRDATNQTIRIEADEIELRRTLATSLMPVGLLDDLSPDDLVDLYAYIRSLGADQPDHERPTKTATQAAAAVQ